MKLRTSMMLLAAIALGGCQTATPTSEVETQAQILSAVPANYRQEVSIFLRGSLVDAGNPVAEIGSPMLAAVGAQDGARTPIVCVRLNPRDVGTGATGTQTLAVAFRDGRIIDTIPGAAACSNAAYGPFPELRVPS